MHERMPMCVGFCVLLAIIYVLSRTGDQDALTTLEQQQQKAAAAAHTPVSNTNSINNNNYYETPSAPVAVSQPKPQQQQSSNTYYEAPPIAGQNQVAQPPMTGQQQPQQSVSSGGLPSYYEENYAPPQQGSAANTEASWMSWSSSSSSGGGSSTSDSSVVSSPTTDCNCPDLENSEDLIAQLREKALANSPPHIIECAKAERGESQEACHLPPEERYAAVGQKGATLWMTGCSGAGKTTIATALEERLVKQYGKHVYRLDGDNLRTGINRDLGFSKADRAESVRRTGELATLFTDAGVITLVGLISPYQADRDAVRKRHEEQGLPFYEVFLDVPIEELKKRDPKGQYANVAAGKLKHFTCIDDPYEAPPTPEITVKTHEQDIEASVNQLFRRLERDGILIGAPKLAPPGLPNPDGDVVIDLHVPDELKAERMREAETLPKVLITDIELNWLQTIGEGWASPLRGFMREGTLLETLHFNSILTDPFNLTGNALRLERQTDFDNFPEHKPPNRVSMPIPITLSCTSYTRDAIEGAHSVALVTQMGQTVAILRDPEVYANRKEEIVSRMFGVIDNDHPYIRHIYAGGDYLIGGEVELLDRIRYNDGLDKWRKTAKELMQEFQEKGADTVYAFQTRNPTHAGHAYLMRSAGEDLRKKGYEKPVLWLSPLGGWTKEDDVPLDVRVKQHEEVLAAGVTHPGGLDPDSTVMAIWPSPMVYAGPTEVQFHAKSRRSAGASYFVVGRDPAGMKGSLNAVSHKDDDLYDGNHGRYVLQNSPGIGDMQMLSFVKVMYDVKDNVMKEPDPSRMDDFISISGSKMRALARNGAKPCPTKLKASTDLLSENCVPAGFMVPNGWEMVVDYYKNIEADRWIPWSKPNVRPPLSSKAAAVGKFGSLNFHLTRPDFDSLWHDIPLQAQPNSNIVNMITEIPMYYTPKMEIMKEAPQNLIAQDSNKDGSARYYTYGVPFFNYGAIPQTWEDPELKSPDGYGGDNDPLDIIELGSSQLLMGSISPCRVLGSFELIDEGETDHKILCISLTDKDANAIFSLADLERVKPGHLDRLKDWLKRYKTSDGKPENSLASETPRTMEQAMGVIMETHGRWKALCGHDGTQLQSLSPKVENFWLASRSCRGV